MPELADEVLDAIGLVIEELSRALDDVKEQAATAVREGRFDDGRALIDTADAMTVIAERVTAIRAEWGRLDVPRRAGVADAPGDETVDASGVPRRYLGRIGRGERTPQAAFRRPILEALVSMGGEATIGDVLEDVGRRMKPDLRDIDFEPLKSDADQIRWRNTAQWSRNELVKEGLMSPSTERGIWSISAAGRRSLDDEHL
jgi:hypothetical protein